MIFKLLILSFFMIVPGYAKVDPDVTVNQVVDTVLSWRKPTIVKEAQERVKKGRYDGTFFKGDMAKIKKVAPKLAKFNPQVREIPRGFVVMAQMGKQKFKVDVEFLDFLNARVKVAGKTVQLAPGLSSRQVLRVIMPPLVAALSDQFKAQKTSLNFSFVSDAIADEEIDPEILEAWEFIKSAPVKFAKGGGKITGIMGSGTGFGFGLAGSIPAIFLTMPNDNQKAEIVDIATTLGSEMGKLVAYPVGAIPGLAVGAVLSAAVAVGTAVAIVLDTAVTNVEQVFSKEDEKVVAQAKEHIDNMLLLCEEQKSRYYKKDLQGEMVLHKDVIDNLDAEGLQSFEEFQTIRAFSSQLYEHLNSKPKFTPLGKKQDTLRCKELARRHKDVAKLERTKEYNLPTVFSFGRKVRPLCDSYKKVVQCFASAPATTAVSVDDSDRSKIKQFNDFFDSLEGAMEARGVVQ